MNKSASNAAPDKWLHVGMESVSKLDSLSVNQFVSPLIGTADFILDFLNLDLQYAEQIDQMD